MCAQLTSTQNDTLFEDEFVQLEMPYEEDSSLATQVEVLPLTFDCFTDALKIEARRRLAYVEWFEAHLSGGWTEDNIKSLFDDAVSILEAPVPNWRTLIRWRDKYIQHGRKLIALIPQNKGKGNRISRLNVSDEVYIEKAISKFLSKEKPSISYAYKLYRDQININNYDVTSIPIKSLSYKGFYNRIKKLPIFNYIKEREGVYKANVEFQSIGAYIPPTYIMERVQVDHTTLDLVLLDDRYMKPIGRPSLTVLLDSYSHCIVGFNLNFKQPSFESVRNALINTIRPKSYVREKYQNIQYEWPCYGKPHTLVVDNGVEFWSDSLEQACLEAKINIQYNPIRKPWLKPLIERFFGILNNSLLAAIPGKTFSNILTKGDYDPQKEAGMRLSIFLELLHLWIIDIYHCEADSRHRYIPILSWQHGFNKLPPACILGEDLAKLETMLSMSFFATHRRGGIHKNHLRYDSNELAAYRMNYPVKTKGRRKVLVKLNPQDISYIYVFIDEVSKLIRVPCVDPSGYTSGLRLDEHLVIVKVHHDFIDTQMDVVSLSRVRVYMNERIEKELGDVKNSNHNKIIRKVAQIRGEGSQPNNNAEHESPVSVKQTAEPENGSIGQPLQKDDWDNFISGLEPY